MTIKHKQGCMAISPLVFFVAIYFLSSIISGDFYKMPITIAFLFACMFAIITYKGKPLKERIKTFCQGAGAYDVMFMLCIFVEAGAFANSAKEIGCIDATVNMTMNILPDNMIIPGLFIATCFISLSIGTSVGTIVALVPIATSLAHSTGTDPSLMVAIIVGGAFFGDNLSFISDTTIVATNTQHCKQRDKFIVNSYTTIPTAIIALIIYFIIGGQLNTPENVPSVNYVKIIPYLIVIGCSLAEINVLVVLTLGIMSTGVIGIIYGDCDFFSWCKTMSDGIAGMGDLIVVAVLAGGLLKILSENGALEYIIKLMTTKIKNKRSCELAIGMLVGIVNICTANNTIAIMTVGKISKDIGDKYGVDNRKNASILDTFSCCVQSILPYGAQILMACGLSAVSPILIIKHLYYPFLLFAVSIIAIIIRYPKKFS